jgi:hypothetical protein
MATRSQLRHPIIITVAGVVLLAAIGSMALARSSPQSIALPPAVGGPPALPLATAQFFRTGGPYLGDLSALQIAEASALSPVGRTEVHLMSYGDVVAWIRSENLYYDRGREMYVAAISARYEGRGAGLEQPRSSPAVCNSYFVVLDATTGTVLSIGCGGPGAWPSNLPAVFSH